MEAWLVPLKPQSLAEWGETDMHWWHELLAARDAWQDGREMMAATHRAVQQATAGMRTGKR